MGVPEEARALIRCRSYKRLLAANAWIEKSDELLHAASLLEPGVRSLWESRLERGSSGVPSRGVIDTYLMLVAYAVENLLKAALVHRRATEFVLEVDNSGKLPAALRKASHNLIALAASVDFSPSRDEEWLLRRLSRAARWSGRYPVPLTVSERSTSERFPDGTNAPTAFNWPRDIDWLTLLCQRIRQMLAAGEPL